MDNKVWTNNECLIFAFKSDRKNAKVISDITMRHLITHNENGCLDENKIESYFIGIIGQLVYDIKYHGQSINVSTYLTAGHNTSYIDANSELYTHKHDVRMYDYRHKFYSLEDLINFLYDRLLLVYPYTRLDLYTLYNNPSLKYYIDLYYNH